MAERQNLVLIAVGADHVGLVEKISEFIQQSGCNIEDSKMAVLAGEFAFMVLVSGEAANINVLGEKRQTLASDIGLDIYVRKPGVRKKIQPSLPYRFTASCLDHPGVVHRLSTILSDLGINIESMETETYAAPDSGTPIFRMEAELSIPAGVSINRLRMQLDEIELQENIDIDLRPA
ncbi:ACT domain-containing protein [bacterium]|nr:ACT domain-containing protein [bacterium]MCI0604526.1 ACT domain-containing protein [bacterium]